MICLISQLPGGYIRQVWFCSFRGSLSTDHGGIYMIMMALHILTVLNTLVFGWLDKIFHGPHGHHNILDHRRFVRPLIIISEGKEILNNTSKEKYLLHYQVTNGAESEVGSNHTPFMSSNLLLIPIPSSIWGGKHPASTSHVTKKVNKSKPEWYRKFR